MNLRASHHWFWVSALGALALLLSTPALADLVDEIQLGYEFTFSYDERKQRRDFETNAFWNRMREIYEAECTVTHDCRVQPPGFDRQNMQIFLEGDFRINFEADGQVIEVTMPKATPRELERREPQLMKYIHTMLGKRFGLKPMRSLGGGHVSLDVSSAFKWDLNLLIDFIEDLIENQTFYAHTFRKPLDAARPITDRYREYRLVLEEARETARKFAHLNGTESLKESFQLLSIRLLELQRFKSNIFTFEFSSPNPDRWRIEFRSPKPQQDIAEGLQFGKLLALHLEHLKKNPRKSGLPAHNPLIEPTGARAMARIARDFIRARGGEPFEYRDIFRPAVTDALDTLLCGENLAPAAAKTPPSPASP